MKRTARKNGKVIRFAYTGIRVRNLDRSLRFYKNVIGMRELLRGRMKAGGVFVQLRSPKSKQLLELNYYPAKAKYYETFDSGSELDHLAFWTEDVDKRFRELTSKGAKKAISPFSEDGYRLAFIKDPDGIWIELIGLDRRTKRK